jgi:hypothetical protein
MVDPLGGLGLEPAKDTDDDLSAQRRKSRDSARQNGYRAGRHQRADLHPSRVVLGRRPGWPGRAGSRCPALELGTVDAVDKIGHVIGRDGAINQIEGGTIKACPRSTFTSVPATATRSSASNPRELAWALRAMASRSASAQIPSTT